ncbi:hypothetical protein IMZ48_38900 [Candidatus Bathyarchaeota archaeon]|nr:hypothetical protein [Candidatus Bathyarchaeota archaeon]
MAPTMMAEITRDDLNALETPSQAIISGVKHLSSYNWIGTSTPTIAVPGSPSAWLPQTPRRLRKDTGLVYINQNAARHPSSPLEPLFRALYISRPSFDIRSTDVVSDRNSIRKLLTFVEPSSSRNGLEAFSITIEVVKDTVILCRDGKATVEIIGWDEFRGFGHEFKKAYTTNEIGGGTGHHRVISYSFGGLDFIIRHETDGYLQTNQEAHHGQDDGLSSTLKSMSLSSTNGHSAPAGSSTKGQPAPAGPGSKLMVKKEGQEVPIDSTIEIKTRVRHKELLVAEVASQLWVSQTPKLVRAYHKGGIFLNPQVEDVTTDVGKWERDNQVHLRKLAALLRRILGVVKGSGEGGSFVLEYEKSEDKLVISKVEGEKMLPEDLYAKWEGGDEDADAGATSDTGKASGDDGQVV